MQIVQWKYSCTEWFKSWLLQLPSACALFQYEFWISSYQFEQTGTKRFLKNLWEKKLMKFQQIVLHLDIAVMRLRVWNVNYSKKFKSVIWIREMELHKLQF